MDTNMVYFIIGIVILAGMVAFAMFRGGKYIGEWIIYGAAGGQLHVYRTRADARNDTKETLQFHLRWAEDAEGRVTQGNNTITIVPTHWIGRMDWLIENIEKQK